MPTFSKQGLSNDPTGLGVLVVSTTAGAGTLVHNAVAATSDIDGDYDEVWLWAVNESAADETLTIEFGGVTATTHTITVTLPSKVGPVQIIPGFLIQNNLDIDAYASSANKIKVYGFINFIDQA